MYGTCRHLLASGRRCTQPAVNETLYCRHHHVIKVTLHKVRPKPDPYGLYEPLPFVFPEDRAALQINYALVIAALNDKRIDIRLANAFNRLFRSCEMNLSKGPLHEPEREKKPEQRPSRRNQNEKWLVEDQESQPIQHHASMVRSVILTPEGEEIAPRREVREVGEVERHGETCPCQKCAEEHRGLEPERHHSQCHCGKCPHPKEPPVPGNQHAVASEAASEQVREQGEQQEASDSPGNSTAEGPTPFSVSAERVHLEEEERLKKLADKAREIFTQLGYREPPSGSGDESGQHGTQFPRTILHQELLCNTTSTAPPCPSSSSPSIPTTPSSPRPANSPGWVLPSR